jgi:hypothetical protein
VSLGPFRPAVARTYVRYTMPWRPSYTREEAAEAIAASKSWSEALRRIGVSPYGKNNTTLRKWAAAWEIATDHLPPYRPRRAGPRFSEAEARDARARSRSWTEALRRLGYCTTGGNAGTLQAWAKRWKITTDHFDPWAANRKALRRANRQIHLQDVLVENSSYSRSNLKRRLLNEGLKQPVCELCGQGEIWRGKRMGLILDHTNGVRDDNRIENLRIVCPNCAATLETHCGRKVRSPTSSSWPRSRRLATAEAVASTASQTTRFANGSGRTSASGRRLKVWTQTWSRSRHAPGQTGVGGKPHSGPRPAAEVR